MSFPTGWAKKCSLTINASQVSDADSADLTNFPVLLTEVNFPSTIFDNTQSAGQDLRFTSDSAGTTELAFEVVNWDTTNDKAEVWVKIPTVDYDGDTTFYVWYGNSEASAYDRDDTYGSENVWDSSYLGVWHLSESGNGTADEFKDSTSNDNHGTGTSCPTRVTGKFTYGQEFDETHYITVPHDAMFNVSALYVQLWTKWAGDKSNNELASMVSKRRWSTEGWQLYFGAASDDKLGMWVLGSSTKRCYGNPATQDTWKMIHGRWDGTTGYIYQDANLEDSELTDGMGDNDDPLYIGGCENSSYYYHGTIDEVRISNSARSVGWLQTEYANQSSPSTFVVEGEEEDVGSTGIAASKRSINC